MDVWLNGDFVSIDDAQVSAFDAGFQHGVGIFETMRASRGRVIDLFPHLERMAESARVLRLSEQMRVDPLGEAVLATLKESGLQEARIRVTVTGGDLNMLKDSGSSQEPTIMVVAQPPTEYPEALYEKGTTVSVADARANPLDPFAGHKTVWYWPRLMELQKAAAKGAAEALWFSVGNHLACGCVSNVLLVSEGRLLTPLARGEEPSGGLPSPVLPGVVRQSVMEWARQEGLEVMAGVIDIEQILKAEEVMLTNSSWGVLPVVRLEANAIGDEKPGSFTRLFMQRWKELLEVGA